MPVLTHRRSPSCNTCVLQHNCTCKQGLKSFQRISQRDFCVQHAKGQASGNSIMPQTVLCSPSSQADRPLACNAAVPCPPAAAALMRLQPHFSCPVQVAATHVAAAWEQRPAKYRSQMVQISKLDFGRDVLILHQHRILMCVVKLGAVVQHPCHQLRVI